MEISHREGVGFNPIPAKNGNPSEFRKETPTKGAVKNLLLEKAGFQMTRRKKLTFKVSFLFFLEHLLGKPFK